jgi:multidrug efflux pump subunit AcrA (membrane-fusion protein)
VTTQGSSAASGYRTATVATEAVNQVLDRVGTIEPVSQASVAFPTGGSVESVAVTAGDQVTTGQPLASLDAGSLTATVAEKQAALDAAEATLERALNGEDVSGAGSDGTGPASDGSLTVSPTAFSAAPGTGARLVSGAVEAAGVDDPDVAAAQQAVLAAQQQVDSDMAIAQQALDDARTICASVGEQLTLDPEASSNTSTPDPSTTTTAPTNDAVSACQDALTAVLDAQQVVADDQTALADASRALDDLLAQLAADVGSGGQDGGNQGGDSQGGGTNPGGSAGAAAGGPGPSSSGTTSGSTPSSPGGSSSSPAGSAISSSPTSEELVAYQKAIDVAAADLTVAQQAVAQATIVSPIAGTVQAVDIAAGDTVTAGSSTATIVVVGDGGYEVTTTVTVDDLEDLAVGQAVGITPDGSEDAIDGEVVRIGVTGTSSGSSTTYPVTIGLTSDADGLRNGATASVSIVTDETTDAVAVPTSAVSVQAGRSTVTVLDDGEATPVVVQVGATGDVWTEITDGLQVGQTVVIADLDEPLPSSATSGSTGAGGFGGGGGLPGGGGFPGGGPPG